MKIFKKIVYTSKKILDTPHVKYGITGGAEIIKILKPWSSPVVEMAKELGNQADKYRLNMLMLGLSKGFNKETHLNELYNYVSHSEERAFLVANIFRQALINQSPKVCCIMGIILGKKKGNDTDFNYDDLIVLNALQTATDYEIRGFKDILDNYMDGENVDIDSIRNDKKDAVYAMVIKWGINNRILDEEKLKVVDGKLLSGSFPIKNKCSDILKEYIDDANQLLQYGKRQ